MSKIIGVAGGSGSGKTYIARLLSSFLMDCAILPLDCYYRDQGHLPPEEREKLNYDDPAVLDLDLFKKHLMMLRNGEPVDIPQYDFVTHTRLKDTRRLEPAKYIIAEGILIYVREDILPIYDLRIFVNADSDIRLARRILRDQKERGRPSFSVVRQYLDSVRPMYVRYVRPSRRKADLIFENNGFEGLERNDLKPLLEAIDNV